MRDPAEAPHHLGPPDSASILVVGRMKDTCVGVEESRDLIGHCSPVSAERGLNPGTDLGPVDWLQITAQHD